MKTQLQQPRRESSWERGVSFLEVLAAIGILSVLVYALSAMLSVALARFQTEADRMERSGGMRSVAEWMERDLAAASPSRFAHLPRLSPEITDRQREFFENRILLPFEINRRQGKGAKHGRSVANAAPKFGSLVFTAEAGGDYSTGDRQLPSIVAYYVAFAKDVPGEEGGRAGMKLFRHVRRSGHPTGEGYADGILHLMMREVNDGWSGSTARGAVSWETLNPAALRKGILHNRDLPFFFSKRILPAAKGGISSNIQMRDIVHPWPRGAIQDRLVAVPPSLHPSRGSPADWSNPASAVHNVVFPDEVLCDYVVRFELTAYRRVRRSEGQTEWMDGRQLNEYLGLSNEDEWPVLVKPDRIELTLATVPEHIAKSLESYEDWLVNWDHVEEQGQTPAQRRIIQHHRSQTFRFTLPPADL